MLILGMSILPLVVQVFPYAKSRRRWGRKLMPYVPPHLPALSRRPRRFVTDATQFSSPYDEIASLLNDNNSPLYYATGMGITITRHTKAKECSEITNHRRHYFLLYMYTYIYKYIISSSASEVPFAQWGVEKFCN